MKRIAVYPLYVIAAVSFLVVPLRAQEQADLPSHSIGAAAGFVSGVGISYRHWFENTYGYQVTLAPYYNRESSTGGQSLQSAFLSLGLNALKVYRVAEVVNFYGYAGVHYLLDYNEHLSFADPGSSSDKSSTTEHRAIVGLGPGIDIHFWRLSVDLGIGVAARIEGTGNFGIQPTGEIALYYAL